MKSEKITEWRPAECGTRIGDIVKVDGRTVLRVKCRRCSKAKGADVFHDIPVAE